MELQRRSAHHSPHHHCSELRVGAALRVVVLCNKGVLHLGVRGHQEAPVRQ
jgi:hypothetical protein